MNETRTGLLPGFGLRLQDVAPGTPPPAPGLARFTTPAARQAEEATWKSRRDAILAKYPSVVIDYVPRPLAPGERTASASLLVHVIGLPDATIYTVGRAWACGAFGKLLAVGTLLLI